MRFTKMVAKILIMEKIEEVIFSIKTLQVMTLPNQIFMIIKKFKILNCEI
jgi:hypothetical protein